MLSPHNFENFIVLHWIEVVLTAFEETKYLIALLENLNGYDEIIFYRTNMHVELRWVTVVVRFPRNDFWNRNIHIIFYP